MPSSNYGGCSSAGSPLTSLANLTNPSQSPHIRQTDNNTAIQEGLRSPKRTTLDADAAMSDFLDQIPDLPKMPSSPTRDDPSATRFRDHRYSAECFAHAPEILLLPPAQARTWKNDLADYKGLAKEDIRQAMDQVAVEVPGQGIRLYVHPVSGDTIIELSNSWNPLLNTTFYYADPIFGRVATKLCPSDLPMSRIFLTGSGYFAGHSLHHGGVVRETLQHAMSKQPIHSPMQVNGKETVHDFGASDLTIIVDKACYRAFQPREELTPSIYRGGYAYDVVSPTAVTHPDFMRNVMKCRKSILAQQSPVFQHFLSTMPDVDTIVLRGVNECVQSRTGFAVMIEVVSFMHTGKLRPYDHDNPEHIDTLKAHWEDYSYVGYYLSLFEAALEYDVVGLPEAIESFIKEDTRWVPTIEDVNDEAYQGSWYPRIYTLVLQLSKIEEKYKWNWKMSPLQGEQQEGVTRLKSIFFEKYERYIANLEGKDYDACDEDDNPLSFQKILIECSNFQADLYAALMKVKRGYEEVYKDEEGNWKIRSRQLQMALRSKI